MQTHYFTLLLLRRLSLLALLCVSAACGGDRATPDDGPDPGSTNRPAEGSPDVEKIKVKTPEKERVVEFKLGRDVVVELGPDEPGRVLRGTMRDSGKRVYTNDVGERVAEVKPGDDSFKVRGDDGTLRWKVKLSPEKIKISDNEEQRDPFEIRAREEGFKVEHAGAGIGKVNFYPDRGRIKVKDESERERFESNSARSSAAYGVLLLERIPEPDRYIIMAEILMRDR